MKIDIVNIGLGNVKSVKNMLVRVGHHPSLCEVPEAVLNSDLIILPGVGAYDHGMKLLIESGWSQYITDGVKVGAFKVFGICLGMQLLCDGSDEGSLPGLGLIPGHFTRIENAQDNSLKVPHMGWNIVDFDADKVAWLSDVTSEQRYYFVHSYQYTHECDDYVFATARYGNIFGVGLQNGHAAGVQFHPEKSHRFGYDFFKQYLAGVIS